MNIEVSSLRHHPFNEEIYSLSSIEDLADSIREVGLLHPLVINDKNEIISGNRRFAAIKSLGWQTVSVERIDVPSDQEILHLIHYNKQRIKTCRELLNEIEHLLPQHSKGRGFRSDLTSVPENTSGRARDKISEMIGISSSQIGKLRIIQRENPEYIGMIDNGDLTVGQAYKTVLRLKKQTESRTTRKSISPPKTDLFTFYHKSSDLMCEVSDDSVDLIFTSPPYYNLRKYSEDGGLGNESTDTEYVDNLVTHFTDCRRVLKDRGSFFIVIGDSYKNGNLLNIPHRVAIGLQNQGWILRNTIIWSKTNPKPSSSRNNLAPTYEFIFHFVKSMDYKYQLTLAPMKHEYKPMHSPNHRDLEIYNKKMNPYIPREGKNMGDFWSEDIVRSAVASSTNKDGLEHPASFPEKIVTLPILQTTEENDLVLDPFSGSHTTGKVANQLGRRYVGYDIKIY